MRVWQLSVGRPQLQLRHGRQYSTAINKRGVAGPVELGETGFDGDQVSDMKVHGGPDKAVCVYPREHYPVFSELLGTTLEAPAFGENLTTEGLLEAEVCIGDVFTVGAALVQVSQPRQPCGKLASKHSEARLVRWVNERQFCGFYFRVLRGGPVAAGDAIARVEQPHAEWSVARATRVILDPQAGRADVEALRDLPALSASWKRQLANKLSGEEMFDE